MKAFGKLGAAAALVSTLALSGCSESLEAATGPIDRSDNCAPYQQAIVSARKQENQLQVRNIAAGALTGAILGAAVSKDKDRGRNALIGGLLGGAVAGVATSEQQRSRRDADAALLRDVNGKAGTARALLTDAGKSAAQLRSCRQAQVTGLERAVRRGEIGTTAARSQLTLLKRRAAADNKLVSAAFNGIGKRVDTFVSTGAQANGVEQAILTRQAAAQTAKAKQVRAATPNVPLAISTKNQVQRADQQRSMQIDRGLDAIDVLLG